MNAALLVGKIKPHKFAQIKRKWCNLKRKRVVYVISPQTVHTVHDRIRINKI